MNFELFSFSSHRDTLEYSCSSSCEALLILSSSLVPSRDLECGSCCRMLKYDSVDSWYHCYSDVAYHNMDTSVIIFN